MCSFSQSLFAFSDFRIQGSRGSGPGPVPINFRIGADEANTLAGGAKEAKGELTHPYSKGSRWNFS